MLEIRNLDVKYKQDDVYVLKDINLQLNSGEINVFIGPSGCGKSTLLNVISGIIDNYNGEVLLNGERIKLQSQVLGLVPQNFGLLPWKNVYDNICLGLKIKKQSILEYKENIEHIMQKLSIQDLKKRYPNQLSGGQKQRVAIARAFIMDLTLLLMDEPFSALDAITREDTQQLFLDVWKEKKSTTLFVTHSVDESVFLGKKIIIMSKNAGKIVGIIENTSFGLEKPRSTTEFFNTTETIRKIIKEEWTNK